MTPVRFPPDVRQHLEGITFDTNLLVGVVPRVFILSIHAENGARLGLLPTVESELRGVAAEYQARFVRRVVRRRRGDGYEVSEKAAAAAIRNIASEYGHEFVERFCRWRDVVRRIEPTPVQRVRRDRLVAQLPANCFRGRGASNDKRIVAETIVHGFTSVATMDVRSMDHFGVNRWLGAHGLLREGHRAAVLDSQTAFRQLCQRRNGSRMLLW